MATQELENNRLKYISIIKKSDEDAKELTAQVKKYSVINNDLQN